ncbi:uncharacterized protein BKCO1_3700086 [Diplodia corticola]|uniref:Uncharacterized protein n=1 Tax=Diplodia corticola TaxID=236234 RepID=A0A1J9QVW6_9PEZI|nr:uncharacterized protein BKCO1_3700086 [Diplodia corticola]OJD32521.1 hypothetical protein BKCO1_3700086 [Diplodia corticola]
MKTAFLIASCTAALAHRALSSPLDPSLLVTREKEDSSCGSNLQVCNPSGASTDKLPPLGPELSGLYLSLLDSVQGINFKRDNNNNNSIHPRDTPSFCCATGTSCVLLSSYNIPFCYDKFTTNYVFPDGSSGTIATGAFSSSSASGGGGGGTANLISGAYAGGNKNLYDPSDPDAAADRPDTATLSIPPQYTAAGVGSAIPLTALGATGSAVVVTAVETTVVSTVPASVVVVPASTRPASTVVTGTTVDGVTTRADSVVPPTTVPASTSTVAAAHETVVTVSSESTATATATTEGSGDASASAAASASATGGAGAAAEVGGRGGVLGAAAAAVAAALLVLRGL